MCKTHAVECMRIFKEIKNDLGPKFECFYAN